MISVLSDCCCADLNPSNHHYDLVVYDISYWDDYFTYFDGSSFHISDTSPPKYRFVGTIS